MYFLIYFLLGILLNIIGPLAEKINSEIRIVHALDEPKIKKILFDSILRILIFLFFPLWYIVILIDYYNLVKDEKALTIKVKEKSLNSIWKTNELNSFAINEDTNRVYFIFFISLHLQLIFGVPKENSKNKNIYVGKNFNSLKIINNQKAAKTIVTLIKKCIELKNNKREEIFQ